jgi:tripartite-type tricarboxylate transporter receptor subunit TctC
VVTKLNSEVRKIFADPQVRKSFLDAQYFDSIAGSPEELSERIRNEEPKWRRLIEEAHIKME